MNAEDDRGLLGLHAGSRMPADADEVDELLRYVPEVSFLPELEASIFSLQEITSVAPFLAAAQIARLASATYLQSLRAALAALKDRATREKNGGLEFLAITLSHFLDEVPPDRHPLIVAMWCRGWARRRGDADSPIAISEAMDDYEQAQGG
jgi:hypothetical protein